MRIGLLFEELREDFMLSLFCSLCLCTGSKNRRWWIIIKKDINLEHRTINSFDFKNQTYYISFYGWNRELVYVDDVKD